jgi:MFS transporter, DHA1 family, tetracycline resistance protein
MTTKKNASLLFIFFTILLDVIGIGLIIPVLPKLVNSFSGNDPRYFGILMGVYALMQFIFAPMIGALSDQYGRRPVLLLSLFTFGMDYILLVFAPSIGWLFLGRVVAGITGASFTTANAYIADISQPEDRAKNFGLVGAAFGVGFIIGPIIGGFLAGYGIDYLGYMGFHFPKEFALRLPFAFAAVLSLANCLYGFFVLPESLKPENRRAFDIHRANPFNSLLRLSRYPNIRGLLMVLICLYLSSQVHPSTWALFTMKQFNWNEIEVGKSLAFVGLMIAIVQGGLIRVITPRLGQRNSVIFGITFYVIGFFLFSLASEGWMMYAIMIPFALGGTAGPTLQALISSNVNPNEQGELQGALTSLMSVTAVVGPILHTYLFATFSANNAVIHYPGAAFLAGSVLSLVALGIVLKTLAKEKV